MNAFSFFHFNWLDSAHLIPCDTNSLSCVELSLFLPDALRLASSLIYQSSGWVTLSPSPCLFKLKLCPIGRGPCSLSSASPGGPQNHDRCESWESKKQRFPLLQCRSLQVQKVVLLLEEEQELIYERVRGIITRSCLRRQKEKDAHPVESAASKLKPL